MWLLTKIADRPSVSDVVDCKAKSFAMSCLLCPVRQVQERRKLFHDLFPERLVSWRPLGLQGQLARSRQSKQERRPREEIPNREWLFSQRRPLMHSRREPSVFVHKASLSFERSKLPRNLQSFDREIKCKMSSQSLEAKANSVSVSCSLRTSPKWSARWKHSRQPRSRCG